MKRVVYVYLGLVFLVGILGFLDNVRIMMGWEFSFWHNVAVYSMLAILFFSLIILPILWYLHLPWTFYVLPLYYFISTAILFVGENKIETWSVNVSTLILGALSLFEVVYSFYLIYDMYITGKNEKNKKNKTNYRQ